MKKYLTYIFILSLFFKWPLYNVTPIPLTSATLPETRKIDLNHDSALWLEILPYVGPKRAQDLINARPFNNLLDITHISGITERHLALWEPYIKHIN